MPISRKKPPSCPIEFTISVIAARWKARILWRLRGAGCAFTQLKLQLPGISDRMLTQQLGELLADGVVHHDRDAPDRPRYRLTTQGESLAKLLDDIEAWGTAAMALVPAPAPHAAPHAGTAAAASRAVAA